MIGVFIVKRPTCSYLHSSVFALIGPYVCYTGVCAKAKSVCQNCCVRKMCVFVFNCSATSPTSLFFFVELALNEDLDKDVANGVLGGFCYTVLVWGFGLQA